MVITTPSCVNIGSNPIIPTNNNNINLNKGDTHMDSIYIISLIGQAVCGCRSTIGFIESKDEHYINRYIEKEYNLILGSIKPNKFVFQNGCHWEYSTNRENVDVHIDIVYNIKKKI